MSLTVGPSGMRSTASYQRVCCSAQKYGVVKTSCMQSICTPCAAASSINFKCFSMLSRLISSMGASVGAALVACMSPHLTVRGMKVLFLLQTLVAVHQNVVDEEPYAEGYEPGVGVEVVKGAGRGDLTAGRGRRAQEAGHDGRDRHGEGGERTPVEAVLVRVAPAGAEETREVEPLPAQHPVVADHNSRDGPHQSRVADEPSEDVR